MRVEKLLFCLWECIDAALAVQVQLLLYLVRIPKDGNFNFTRN